MARAQTQAAGVEGVPIRLAACVLVGRYYSSAVQRGPGATPKCVCQGVETRKWCSRYPCPQPLPLTAKDSRRAIELIPRQVNVHWLEAVLAAAVCALLRSRYGAARRSAMNARLGSLLGGLGSVHAVSTLITCKSASVKGRNSISDCWNKRSMTFWASSGGNDSTSCRMSGGRIANASLSDN